MKFKLAVLPGDGVGPEVVAAAVQVLQAVGRMSGHEFVISYSDIGGVSIDRHGVALTEDTLKMCKRSHAYCWVL